MISMHNLILILCALDFGDCLRIGIVWTINFVDFLSTGIVRKTVLGYCTLIGISRTIGLEGGLLIALVRTAGFRD